MEGIKYPVKPTSVPPIPHKRINKPKPEPGPVPTSQPNVLTSLPPVLIAGSNNLSPK
jgi:hypothetical protein